MNAVLDPDVLWLAQAAAVVLLAGLAAAVIVGTLLLVRPGQLLAFNARLSRWIDTSQPFEALDQPRTVERFFYRHHRALGALLATGAGYVLLRWAFGYDRTQFLASLHRAWAFSFDWVVVGLEWIVVLLHAGILALGVVIFTRPSLLKGLEGVANRWHDAGRTGTLDTAFHYLETCFEAYPRASGLVVLVASGWSLAALVPYCLDVLAR
jgi:hypothetical protein